MQNNPQGLFDNEEFDLITANHIAVLETTSEDRMSASIDIALALLLMLIGLAFLILFKLFKRCCRFKGKYLEMSVLDAASVLFPRGHLPPK